MITLPLNLEIIPKGTVGVALSGGADSVALLLALRDAGCDVVALHCNFELRGDESDGDEAYCRELCSHYNIPLSVVRFDTERLRQQRESVEMACRRLRYDWFCQQREELNLACVALAHHREDRIETLFINLLRGSGPTGLASMPAVRDFYVRPLLDATRDQIEEYLAHRGVAFRTDSSNLTNQYRRNALRNDILPAIRQYFPAADAGLARTMDSMRRSSNMISLLLSLVSRNLVIDFAGHKVVDVSALKQLTDDPSTLLYLLFNSQFDDEITIAVAEEICAVTDITSSKFFQTVAGSQLEFFQGKLFEYIPQNFNTLEFSLTSIPTDVFATIEQVDYQQFLRLKDDAIGSAKHLFIDIDELPDDAQFRLRDWRSGDRIKPFGMKGSRLLSDIFTDCHLSHSDRNCAKVLELLPDKILWVTGVRTSAHFPVSPTSHRILHLSIH